MRVPTAIWWLTPELVTAIDAQLGPPVDSYVNGAQTWFTGATADDADATLEWRLHPVGAFHRPAAVSHYDLWELTVAAVAGGADPDHLPLGGEERALTSLWDGLECFPAYGDDLEPPALARRAVDVLGLAPHASGLVDHDVVGDEWERTHGQVSILQLLADQLHVDPRVH